jgi:alpha-galactosidase
MAGVLGIGSDLLAWSGAQRNRAAELVALYRDIRDTIHRGRVEPHGLPADPVYSLEYGTATQTVVLVWGRSSRPGEVRIRPRTLVPDARYRFRGVEEEVVGGAAVPAVSVPFTLALDTDVLIFDRVG